MSASLDTICPIPDDLIPPAATDALRELERAYSFIEQIYTGPNPMDEHCISDLRTALAASAAAKVSLGTLEPPRDYPEAVDEDAHAAMEAERNALQARVTELERERANLLRDIAYLNGKLERVSAVVEAAHALISPYTIQGNHGFYIAAPEYRALENAIGALAQPEPAAGEGKS